MQIKEEAVQAAERLCRFPVNLYDHGFGDDLQDSINGSRVHRGFKGESAIWCVSLECLQDSGVILVGSRSVRLDVPIQILIKGCVCPKEAAEEGQTHQGEAFLWRINPGKVDIINAWEQQAGDQQLSFHQCVD